MLDHIGNIPKPQIESNEWKKWFAWRPVKIKNKRIWLKTVYRRETTLMVVPVWCFPRYEYGTLFNVLSEQ